MKQFVKNNLLLLLLSIVLFTIGHFFHKPIKSDSASIIENVEKTLHKKEKRLIEEMDVLASLSASNSYQNIFASVPSYYSTLMQSEGIALLIYENDTLKFWSDNSIAVENWIKEVCLDTKMAKLQNGWFEVMKPKNNGSSSKNIVGLILIKNEFPYQNKYLKNEFQHGFSLPNNSKLLINDFSKNVVKSISGENLFAIDYPFSENLHSWSAYFSFFLILISFAFFMFFLKKSFISLFPKIGPNTSVLIFSTAVVVLRYLSIKLSFPSVFYTLDLFNPKIYADASSIWLTSLGDLLINISILFFTTHFIVKFFEFDFITNKLKKANKLFLGFFSFLIFFWFSWVVNTLFIGLIKNSNISFSINNLFSLNIYSFVGIFIVATLLFVFFLLSNKIIAFLKSLSLSVQQYILLFVLSTSVHALISHFSGTLDLVVIFWPFAILSAIVIITKKTGSYSFSGAVFLVFMFSVFAVHVFTKHTRFKENETRKIYAERLAAEQDPVAELLFEEVKSTLLSDTTLFSYLNTYDKQPLSFEKHIKQEYFSGFWEKYDVRIALFDSMCFPVILPPNSNYDNNLSLDELIEKRGLETSCEGFSFINNENGKINYLGKIQLKKSKNTKQNLGILYIELDGKYISEEIGFPELLLDKNIGLTQELSNYSYAKYKGGKLISHYGKFPYSYNGSEFKPSSTFNIYDHDSFNHLVYQPKDELLIVVSKPSEELIGKITSFSYLFAYFSLILLIILLIKQISKGALFENFSFKYRIQVLLVLIVLTSLALFGGGTIFYIQKQFETKNKATISEKIHSIKIDLSSKLSEENYLSPSLSSYTTFILKKLSNIFFTDINIYDVNGNLFASSRPKVFEEGLTSKKMNPEAFKQISINNKTEFVHDERIGDLEYLSVYIPFKNNDDKIIAYLNLPYFAKQNELEKEIAGFLVALINIYVLLFALSILLAILISNYVTKPLKLIQDKLSKIKLGKANELIEWKEKDEIGNLVSEYNRMINELSRSADLLAKSERESAWREMAKQVAHEIKNPLTPMKLSIQHLQRTWNDNDDDKDKKIEQITKTIVEQIDSLSSIATAFSNFAQMPKTNLEHVDLIEIINSSILLFNENETIEINFSHPSLSIANVFVDKEQMLRVFNNLFKNAIQSIPENQNGKIEVNLSSQNEFFTVSISDNGEGIDEAIIDKIFNPNFTTKTGGMGLGLAMVKSIVENSNGKIWFETKKGVGTTFYIELKKDAIQ